jgi:cbb3-type cytochrome oxidase subunit 3
MIREVLSNVNYSMCAEAAMCLFFGVFVAVAIRTFLFTKKDWVQQSAAMPLNDGETDES